MNIVMWARRIRVKSLHLGFGLVLAFALTQAQLQVASQAQSSNYGSGSNSNYGNGNSGPPVAIYLPNGTPFYTGTNYPGGIFFPHNPSFSYPSPAQNQMIRYNPYARDQRNIQQTRTRTTWEAPTAKDAKIEEEIEITQVDHGIDSKAAIHLIWSRAKQYYDGHYYDKAGKMLDQLEPLVLKQGKASIVSTESILKMRQDIALKTGKYAVLKPSYTLRTAKDLPVPLDVFLDPSANSSAPYGSSSGSNYQPGRRNFYP